MDMKEIFAKLLENKNFVETLNYALKGQIQKEFNQCLSNPSWRYRIFKLILLKELNDCNLSVFLHAVIKSLDKERVKELICVLDQIKENENFVQEENSGLWSNNPFITWYTTNR